MKVLMDLVLRLILIAAVSAGATVAVADEGDKIHQISFKDKPLPHAAHHGDLAEVKALLGAGVETAQSALKAAAAEGHPTVVKVLLDAGANPNTATEGWTAFMSAAHEGRPEIVKIFLAVGANPNTAASGGLTPLMMAAGSHVDAQKAHDSVAKYIGDPPKIWALPAAYVEVIKLLLAAGANPNLMKDDGWTALMFAATTGSANITRLLIKAEADVNAANADGETALDIALDVGDRGVARILRKAGAEE